MIERLRRRRGRIIDERITSEDVTAEFIDTSARLVAQKALEAQYLELLKQVKSVKDALEVQAQLAAVRTEVEKLVGRRRFLNDQSALSTMAMRNYCAAPWLLVSISARDWSSRVGMCSTWVEPCFSGSSAHSGGSFRSLCSTPFVVLGRRS